jgi:hypothetical protein
MTLPVRLGLLLLAPLLAACSTVTPPMQDPGRLEVWNGLRDALVVIVGGRLYPIGPCQVTTFDDVELRGVRLASPAGIQVAVFPADTRPTPIGPVRYIVVGQRFFVENGGGIAMDLRTRPNSERPDGRSCQMTLEQLLNPDEDPGDFDPGRGLGG